MLNTPNALAFSRIAIAPLIFAILLYHDDLAVAFCWHPSWVDYFAALLFVLAGVTDFFDGYVARLWNESTKIGAILDPLADKMLMLAAFLGLMSLGRANAWAVFLILTREFFITGLRVAAVAEGKNIAATKSGKIKTGLQLVAVGFLIMQWPFASLLFWVATIFTIYSGYEYSRDYFRS